MEAVLPAESLFAPAALLAACMAEGGVLLPPVPVSPPLLYQGEDQSGKFFHGDYSPSLVEDSFPERIHESTLMVKSPKVEPGAATTFHLPASVIETPVELDRVKRIKRIPLLPSCLPPRPLSPTPLLLSSASIGEGSPAMSARQQPIPPNARSRDRRRGVSERMRLLAKLMPWERKMTTSAMLEEARDYIKFLEAQVAALQCMPAESRFVCPLPSSYGAMASMLGGLETLTRQQLLYMLVRSPLVQDKLCARGLCVFSSEQVILLRQAAERNKRLHLQLHQQHREQMTVRSGSSSTVSD